MKPDWDDRKPRKDDWKSRAEFAGLVALTVFIFAALALGAFRNWL